MEDSSILEKRREKLKSFFANNGFFHYVILGIIIIVGYLIRIKNLVNLRDVTTGKYIPIALDPFVFLRYAKEVLANGSLAAVDTMRYVPFGYEQIGEFDLLSHVIVWLYKFLHFFNSAVTIEYAHVIYPPVFFCLSLIFFFLLIRRLFDYRVGLLATAFLAVLPSYLFRTLAGFSDKESLAMFFMFAAIYYYVRAWKEIRLKNALFFGLVSGVLSGMMGLTWGGVSFLFALFGFFVLICVMLDRFTEREFYVYFVWLFSMTAILIIFFGKRYTISNLALGVTSGFMFLALFVSLINLVIRKYNVLNIKNRFENKIPLSVVSLIISGILGVLIVTVVEGFGAIIEKINVFFRNLIEPFGFTRWNLTVAESHQPYVADWIGQLGWLYILLMIIGAIFLVYTLLKNTKLKWWGTGFFALFIFAFIFSRYKANSVLNGVTSISKFFYIGSLVIFGTACVIVYFYSYIKDKGLFESISKFDKNIIFVLVWFLIMTVAARGAIRLLHIYSPVTTILVAYAFVKIYDFAKGLKIKYISYGIYAVLILMLVLPNVQGTMLNMYNVTSNQAKYTGASYNQQWQNAMAWVRDNTEKDAVFAHWWDYGYWVQTGGERATLTDGGNAGGYAMNYFMGRHVITGQSEKEALEYLYARNATHLLMISDEIGKYPAFSSIGSDVNYDRYGWINTFNLDLSRTQERRDDTLLVYTGSYTFDEDFIFNDVLYAKQHAGIGGFFVPATMNGESVTMMRPEVAVVGSGGQINVPLNCLFINGEEIIFGDDGIDGCLMIIPNVNGDKANAIGSALYISPKIRRTLFAQIYLFGKTSENFKLVYTDEGSFNLLIYNGRLLGPLKVWETNYPDGLEPSEYYYKNELPDPRVIKS
ncbi:MAG: STT3 domain-containing protein [Nanoarchaeota archaeon]|nr:STT3 domain-containing protein [Nanoarchaeota archaeon]